MYDGGRHYDDHVHDPHHDDGGHDRGYVNERYEYDYDRDRGDEYACVHEHEYVWFHHDRAHVRDDEYVRDDVPENFVRRAS